MDKYDFSGWATKNNIECSDGRIIMKDAFKNDDGHKVPLVWNHQHDDPSEVLGHALLENREEGVYAYCKFNDTESGQTAKALVMNGDVDKLSIYANKLKSELNNVVHGCIREVSLVLAGANPGAYIDSVITHSDESGDEEEGIIYTDEFIDIKPDDTNDEGGTEVSEEKQEVPTEEVKTETEVSEEAKVEETEPSEEAKVEETEPTEEIAHADETIGDVINTLTDEQKEIVEYLVEAIQTGKTFTDEYKTKIANVMNELNEHQKDAVYALVGMASEETENNNEKGEENNMKHNVFENDAKDETLMHSEFVKSVITDAKKYGSMKESFLAHADDETGLAAEWGQDNDYSVLFPDAVNIDKEPRLIEKDDSWVAKVMGAVKHSPFSRVKNTLGRMNEETARAKGYIKGTKKE